MKYSISVIAAIAAYVSAHGVVTQIKGANGVVMPGLSVIDNTPRDCASPRCGSEADTSIIRTRELGTNRASALGRTMKGGPVDAAAAVSMFMGSSPGPGAKSNKVNKKPKRSTTLETRQLLGGGKGKGAGAGSKTPQGTVETGWSKAAGTGAQSGMPTVGDDGVVNVVYHQVNQDGAGGLSAQIDNTSGGTDAAAFKDVQVTQNVPGAILGLSATKTTDFPVKVQMPKDMACSGTVAGVGNMCVLRMANKAIAGPFGGSVAFVQTPTQRKRSLEYALRKRELDTIAKGIEE